MSQPGHPVTGWADGWAVARQHAGLDREAAGWGSRDVLEVTLVDPQMVVEVDVDVARDGAGRWRHPVRLHRPRLDLTASDVPPFGSRMTG